MAKTAELYLPVAANNLAVTFVNADGTTAKTCFTAGAEGSDVKSIIVTSTDTAAINLQLFIVRSAVNYLLATVNIPIASGSDGTALSVDLLALIPGLPLDNAGKAYLALAFGDSLKIGPLVAVTAAKTCYINALGQNY